MCNGRDWNDEEWKRLRREQLEQQRRRREAEEIERMRQELAERDQLLRRLEACLKHFE